jgi:type I restriction enzyme S subunit
MEAIIDYRGKSPRKTQFGIPLITAKVVKKGRIETPDEFIASEDYQEWMRRGIPKAGDVLITTEAPLGEVAQLDGRRVALAQRLIALRGKPGIVDNTFLKFLLQSAPIQDALRARSTGTTVSGISQAELRKLQLRLPPIQEQCAIGQVLAALDEKIELNRKMSETLEAIARALFKSWFVDFDPVRAKTENRDPGLPAHIAKLFPRSFEDSGLGLIPTGWRISKLVDACENIFSGGTPSTTVQSYWGGGIPWLSSGETRQKFVLETERTVSQLGVEQSSTRFARAGATVIASAGQGNTRGQTSMLMLDAYVNQSVVALLPHPQRSTDLHLFFDLERRYEEFRRISDGHSSRGSLTTKLLASVPLVQPPFELVCAFDTILRPVIERITCALRESNSLNSLRDALLPRLISGELRVNNIPGDNS